MKPFAALLTAILICQPLWAGNPAEREEEMRRAREKETNRAREMANLFGNREEFETKYGHLKQDFPEQFAAAAEKRQRAAAAWQTAAKGFEGSTGGYEQFAPIKFPAYEAEALAELARLELKAAAAEKEWKRSAEKTGSREAEQAAQELIRNQKEMIQATKAQMSSQRTLRQLEIDRVNLEKKMRDAYEQSKRKAEGDRVEKEKHHREEPKPFREGGQPGHPERPNPPPNAPRVD